jgi:hypothetical protein
MTTRVALVAMAVFALFIASGCGNDDPTVVVDTDYDFLVSNYTKTDFEVFRSSSISDGEWELLGLLKAGEEVVYISEVGVSYTMRCCLPDEGPEEWQRTVSYGSLTTDPLRWGLYEYTSLGAVCPGLCVLD